MRWINLLWLLVLPSCVSYQGTPVSSAMLSSSFIRKFVRSNCGYGWDEREQQPEPRRKECSKKFGIAFATRLHDTYPSADMTQVMQKCESSSRVCDPVTLEHWAQDFQEEQEVKKQEKAMASGSPAMPPPSDKLATPYD